MRKDEIRRISVTGQPGQKKKKKPNLNRIKLDVVA
jgi:hypothetical protein